MIFWVIDYEDTSGHVKSQGERERERETRGVDSLLYFAYTCVMDPFIGGLFTLQKRL